MSNPDDARETQMSAYFDGELDDAARAEFEAAVAADPALQAMLDDFAHLQTAVRADLEAEAAGVPAARFEQVWDEVERAISRAPATVASNPTLLERLGALLGGWRAPAAVAVGACAVAFVIYGPNAGAPGPDAGMVAEAQPSPSPEDGPSSADASPSLEGLAAAPGAAQDAVKKETPFPVVSESDATIDSVDANGADVRVDRLGEGDGRTGTVVIFVEELDEEAATGGYEL